MRNFRYCLSLISLIFLLHISIANGIRNTNTSPDSIENLKKINTVNLLVPLIFEPLDTRTVQYTLRGYNGCYEWFSTKPDILKVEGYDGTENICHPQALVSLATNKPWNNVIWIHAKDKETNDVLRCESRVARIHRVEILTKLRTIDVGDVEILEVLGYDQEGNVFSTLEGIRFEWSILAKEAKNLELISIKDSQIKTTELRKRLESSNFQTDIIVAKGLQTGQATVTVKVKERDYPEVQHSVILYVIEHFIVYPDDTLYVLPYTTVSYTLALIKTDANNRVSRTVALPSKNYEWINLNKERAVVGQDGIVQCLGDAGQVHIKVNDTQTLNNTVENFIHIVKPSSLDIQIREFTEGAWEVNRVDSIFERNGKFGGEQFENVWNLIRDKEYYVKVFLYDDKRNLIKITPNVKILFNIDSEYIEIIESRNHELRIRPKTLITQKRLTASLDKVVSDKGTYIPHEPIQANREYSVLSKVKIVKPQEIIHLPLLGGEAKSATSQQTFKLYAFGGSKRYEWVPRDLEIASVSREGVLLPKKVGRTVIEVQDVLNNKNIDAIEVEVSQISDLVFLEKLEEIVVNSTGYVNVYARGPSRQKYSNCSFLNINTNIDNPTLVTQLNEELPYENYLDYLQGLESSNIHYRQLLDGSVYDSYFQVNYYDSYIRENAVSEVELRRIFKLYKNYGVCSRIVFRGEFKGETSVKAVHGRSLTSSEELRLRVYDQFNTLEPALTYKTDKIREVILSFLSSFQWNLEGGPMKWEDNRRLNSNIEVISTNNKGTGVLKYNEIPTIKSRKSLLMECLKPERSSDKGPYEYTVRLSLQNDADPKLPDPVRLETELSVSCRNPNSIEIYILKEGEKRLDVNTVQNALSETFTIRNNQYYDFQTWVFDENKRPFYNFSSLKVDWSLQPPSAGSHDALKFSERERVNSWAEDQYRKVILTATEGEVILRAEVRDYESNIIPSNLDRVSDDVIITIKGDIELEPSEYVLYYHPDNSFDIKILRGSGDFAVSINDSSIAKFQYNRNTQTITVHPLRLGYAQIIVEDHKLVRSQRATCQFVVAGADRIELSTEENLLEEHHSTLMSVSVYEATGRKFKPRDIQFIGLNLDIDTDREYYKQNALKIASEGDNKHIFRVEGKLTGNFKLIASAEIPSGSSKTRKIVSNIVELHVFPKLTANPSRLVVAPGCLTALEVLGGPSEKAKVLYNVELYYTESPSIEIRQQDASFFAIKGLKLADTEIEFGIRFRNGRTISFVKVPVKVALVDSVEILAMLDRKIHVGAQTRLIAVTKVNGEAFRFALCSYQYDWISKNENVLQIHAPPATHLPCNDIAPPGKEGSFHLENYNIAVNATALSVGVAEVELRLRTDYSSATHYNSGEFITTVKIRVIPILTMNIPTYIGVPTYFPLGGEPISYAGLPTCNDLPPAHPVVLLIPPNTDYQIRPNRVDAKVNYTLFASTNNTRSLLTSTGQLTTYNEKGKLTVLVEDLDTEAELMMINVLITDVYSIFVEDSYKVLTLPVDADSALKIHLQDALGRSFPSPSELLKLSLSVSVSNHKVLDGYLTEDNSAVFIKAKSEGVALVTVYLTHRPEVFDIFTVMVGTIITPSSPVRVHLGGQIQFAVTSSIASEAKNRWSSDESGIVRIDSVLGKAVAMREGTTNIHFSDTIKHATKVNVFKVDKILRSDPSLNKMSNVPSSPFYQTEYRIPFRVYSDDNQEIKKLYDESGVINNNLIFDCVASPKGWVTVTPLILNEGDRQVPSCKVSLATQYPENQRVPSEIVVHPTLTTKDRSLSFTHSQPFAIKVDWAFKVVSPQKKTITLNRQYPNVTISVQADDHDLKVSGGALSSFIRHDDYIDSNGLTHIKIEIPRYKEETVQANVEIQNTLTGQTEMITVHYSPGAYVDKTDIGTKTPTNNPLWNLSAVDVILLIIVAIVIFSLIVSMKGYSTKNVQTPYNRPVPGPSGGYGIPYRGGYDSSTSILNTPENRSGLHTSRDHSDNDLSRSGFGLYQRKTVIQDERRY